MNIKSLFILLTSISLSWPAFGQEASNSPYELDWKKDVPLATVGIGLSLAGKLSSDGVNERSEAQVANASFKDVLGLDEHVNDNYSTSAAKMSDWVYRGAAVLPLTLLVDRDIRKDAGKIAVLGSESLLITYGLTTLAKSTLKRNRPFVFNEDVPLEKKLTPDSRFSFFSGHTSATSTATFFTAKVWSDYHPDSKWKPVVWTAAATIPAVTGYLRVKAGKHYVSDVTVGYAVGALVGYFVPHLHKIKRGEKRKLRMSTTMIDDVPVFNVRCRF
jgi:membrane-associated phospholipid phosphatase